MYAVFYKGAKYLAHTHPQKKTFQIYPTPPNSLKKTKPKKPNLVILAHQYLSALNLFLIRKSLQLIQKTDKLIFL